MAKERAKGRTIEFKSIGKIRDDERRDRKDPKSKRRLRGEGKNQF